MVLELQESHSSTNVVDSNKILYGACVAKDILEKLKLKIQTLQNEVKFVIIQVGNNSVSDIYIKRKILAANQLNIAVIYQKFPEVISYNELKDYIQILNNDHSINGIIVQLPVPTHLLNIMNEVSPFKDIDGLTIMQKGNLFAEIDGLYPCTALGVMYLLNYYNIELESKKVAVIGRSKLVGKPLAMLLLQKNAMVSMFHSKLNTNFLETELRNYDIICSAVGKYGLIKKDFIKKDVILIDIGCSKIDNYFYGDFDHSCYEKASYYTPVPKGIGPITVAFLMYNIVKVHCMQNGIEFL